jgi:hypothetical protein
MKRTIVSLAALAALALPAGTAQAALDVPVRTYPVYCGFTVIYQCGICVEAATYTNCTYW